MTIVLLRRDAISGPGCGAPGRRGAGPEQAAARTGRGLARDGVDYAMARQLSCQRLPARARRDPRAAAAGADPRRLADPQDRRDVVVGELRVGAARQPEPLVQRGSREGAAPTWASVGSPVHKQPAAGAPRRRGSGALGRGSPRIVAHRRVSGDVAGQFWYVIGLHRYDVGELDALVSGRRLADEEPLYRRS